MLIEQVAVHDTYQCLVASLENLCQAIKTDNNIVSVCYPYYPLAPIKNTDDCKKTLQSVLNTLHYLNEQAPREILTCPGIVGASPHIIKLAREVNVCKIAFKKAVLNLKESKKIQLKAIGLARVHLKQCYRLIPILDKTPSKISWTWAHTRAIKKITVLDAMQRLTKKGHDVGIQIQTQKLNTLSEKDPLAIIQDLAPHLRANLVFELEDKTIRKMIKGPVPIFFEHHPGERYPQFKPPGERQAKNDKRAIRKDTQIDPNPFLPAIRAHRYL